MESKTTLREVVDQGVRGDLGKRSIGERGQAPVLGPRAIGRVLLLVIVGSPNRGISDPVLQNM